MKLKKLIIRHLKGLLFFLIVLSLSIIFYILILPHYGDILWMCVYLMFSIIALFVYLYYINPKGLKDKFRIIEVVSVVLFAFFMFMTFYLSYLSYQETIEINKPKLTVQLTSSDIPWGHFADEFEHTIYNYNLTKAGINLPIYLTVNNYGSVPTQLYNVGFETSCDRNKGLLSLPRNKTTLVKPGEFFKLKSSLYIDTSNSDAVNFFPCEIKFTISGPNFDVIKKYIIIKIDKSTQNERN